MNNQLNCYSDKNIHFSEFQYEILDDIAKTKPSLDGMYNIEKTDLDRPFLQDLAKIPSENLLGQNVNGANSPIAEQIKSLNNEPKINKNIIVMTTDKPENYDSINMSELSNDKVTAIEEKIKELEESGILNNINENVNNTPIENVNNTPIENVNNTPIENVNNTPSVILPEPEVVEVELDNIEVELDNVEIESNINKTFRDLFHKTVTNKIILFLFLVVIGILFSVYKKQIMKLFS
jgi:hypothetical protein